nr:MAG TPA: hypothetical protein [Caudoviricetes sp.]
MHSLTPPCFFNYNMLADYRSTDYKWRKASDS